MKRKYIVLIDVAKPEQDSAFKNWAMEKGFKYWHWISHSWLLIASQENDRGEEILDKTVEIYEGANTLVFTLQGNDSWFGYGPASKKNNNNMFNWLNHKWD